MKNRLVAWATRKITGLHWLAFGHQLEKRREMDDRNTELDPREGELGALDQVGEEPMQSIRPKGHG